MKYYLKEVKGDFFLFLNKPEFFIKYMVFKLLLNLDSIMILYSNYINLISFYIKENKNQNEEVNLIDKFRNYQEQFQELANDFRKCRNILFNYSKINKISKNDIIEKVKIILNEIDYTEKSFNDIGIFKYICTC